VGILSFSLLLFPNLGKKIGNVDQADRDEWEWSIKEEFNEEIKLNREKVK